MSGHKHTTITTQLNQIRAFSQEEISLRYIESGLDKLSKQLDEMEKQSRAQTKQQTNGVPHTQVYNLALIDEQLGSIEQTMENEFAYQSEQITNHLQQVTWTLNARHYQSLRELQNNYRIALENTEEQLSKTIQPILDNYQCIVDQHTDKLNYYQQWLAAVSELQASIENNSEIDYLFPGLLIYTQDTVAQAEENHHVGYIEAALVSLQKTYRVLSKYIKEYLTIRDQQDELYRVCWNELTILEQEILLNLHVPAIDLDGNVLGCAIVVDEWVNNALSQLLAEVHSQFSQIDKKLSRELVIFLQNLIRISIPAWRSTMGDLVYQARVAAINSQLRMNIAAEAMKALQVQGYNLEMATYDDKDMRKDYCIHMTDLEGSRVKVIVTSSSENPNRSDLHIFTTDIQKLSPHEIQQRSLEIQRCLQRAGLHAGPVTAENHRNKYIHEKLPEYSAPQQITLKHGAR